jgi:cytoplasmic tRNA 2-thiolation protein 2
MCQVNEEDDEAFQALKSATNKTAISRKCMSCDENACVVVRIADPMCRKCFEEFFIHKFRSTISKSNVFGRGERVLIAYSGGPSSSALLHLIAEGLSVNARRRLQFQAHVAFIDESSLYPDSTSIRDKVTDLIANQMQYPLHIVSIDENLDQDNDLKEILFTRTKSLTAREELLRRRKLKLLFDIAINEKCTKLITGDNCTKLAAQILSDMAQGKGAHVALECVSKIYNQ